jgi:hypothetical protein
MKMYLKMVKFLKPFQVLCSSGSCIWGGSTSDGLGRIQLIPNPQSARRADSGPPWDSGVKYTKNVMFW